MLNKITISLFILLVGAGANAQSVGIGTTTPNSSAALDISSTTGGLLLPRMTSAQRDALTPVPGMLIQNTTLGVMQSYEYTNVIDQSQTTSNIANYASALAQSFTAGVSGNLYSVTVLYDAYSGSSTLNIRNGDGLGGAIIATQNINVASGTSGTEIEFVLTAPPSIINGNKYTIEFAGANTWGARFSSGNNPYSGGILYFGGVAQSTSDLYFRTKVTTPGGAIWQSLNGGLPNGTAAGNTPYWDGTSWVVNSSNIFNNGGNIGIGTTSPSDKLHIKGGSLILDDSYQRYFEGGQPKWDINGGSTNYAISRSGIDYPFYIDYASGNVGINNTSPAAKLDITGNIKITDGSQGAGKVLSSDVNGLASWVTPGLGSGTAAGNTPYWDGTSWVVNSSNIFNNGGNIGIGTTSPGGKLHIKGGSLILDDSYQRYFVGGSPKWDIYGDANGYTISRFGIDFPLYITHSNGYTGIGTTNPLARLSVGLGSLTNPSMPVQISTGSVLNGSQTEAYYGINTNGNYGLIVGYSDNASAVGGVGAIIRNVPTTPLNFAVSNTTIAMTILGNANVGIGTTNPGFPLDVSRSNAGSFAAQFFNTAGTTASPALLLRGSDAGGTNGSWLAAFDSGNGTTWGTIAFTSTGVAYNTTSDMRLKKNITDSKTGIDALKKILIKDYQYKDRGNDIVQGVLAQQLYEIYPQAVTKGTDELDEKGRLAHPWMVDYGKLTPLLIKAVQDQQAEIELLQDRLKTLEAKLK